MRKEKFLELVKNPVHDQETSEDELSSLIRQFPYSQPLRILYLRKLHENNSVQYATQLKITAAYAPDRARLYNLILGKPEEEIFPSLMELEEIAEALPVTEIKQDEIKSSVIAIDQEINNQENELEIPEITDQVLSPENISNDDKNEDVYHEINPVIPGPENINEENITEDETDELTPQQIIDLRLRELGIWTEPAPSHDFSSVESLNLKDEKSTEDIQTADDEIVFEDVSNFIQPVNIQDHFENNKDELTSSSTPQETDTPVFEIEDIHIDNTEADLRYVEDDSDENLNTEVKNSEVPEFASNEISHEDDLIFNSEEEQIPEEKEVEGPEAVEDIDEEAEENIIPSYSYSGTIRDADETSDKSDADQVNRLILENLVENSYFPAPEKPEISSGENSKNENATAASQDILTGEIHSFTEWLKLKKKTTVPEQLNIRASVDEQPETVNKFQDIPEGQGPIKTSTPVFNEPLSEPRLIYSREEKSGNSADGQISAGPEPEENPETTPDQTLKENASRNRASEIIEKFIEQEPRISPAKSTFYSPVNMARKSVQEPDDLITETLARIYAQQGNFKKAIDIYEKMALKFPEKRRYFAALIEDLNNKSNS